MPFTATIISTTLSIFKRFERETVTAKVKYFFF